MNDDDYIDAATERDRTHPRDFPRLTGAPSQHEWHDNEGRVWDIANDPRGGVVIRLTGRGPVGETTAKTAISIIGNGVNVVHLRATEL